jgi:hypothetical protein
MKIIKAIKIKVKKVYFTTSAAIVLFIIIAGCVSTQPHTTQVQTASQTIPTPTPATSSPPQQEKLPSKTLRPISVVASVQIGPSPTIPGGVISPGGPPSWVTVTVNANSTDVAVTKLSATVLLALGDKPAPAVCNNFSISERNPLMPGQTALATCGYRVRGSPVDLLKVNGTAAVLIEGTLQNGQSFSYWTNDTTS